MSQTVYRIRKLFLTPLAIDTLLLFVLLLLSWFIRSAFTERAVLVVLFIAALAALIEGTRRTIAISETGLSIHKFFRMRTLAWADITHIGCLLVRSRVYILLTTTRGFYVISNAYDRFPQMIRELTGHMPSETVEVEDEVRTQIDHPVRNTSDIIAAWFAAVVLAGIIYMKLTS